MTLHGHYLDHLTIIEPWADRLRDRQVDGDPFIAHPAPPTSPAWRPTSRSIDGLFDELVRGLPQHRWLAAEVTPGWTLRDHVGHLADWMDEGARAIDIHRDTGVWLSDPEEGIDAGTSATSSRDVANPRKRRSPATTRPTRGCWARHAR